ncbi:MAG: protease modulator HflC, partial [Gammaproteobacteria bacterium]|nr:protease modulator HflC [Gammaproteobacteria bacterium]
MSPKASLFLIVLAAVVIVGSMSVFVVDEREHALRFQFGEIVDASYEPGLHFKWPVIQNVVK